MAPHLYLVTARTFTILSGATVSDALDCLQGTLLGLQFPAALTSTTMTFQVSHDGTTYVALTDTAGAALSITVAASKAISIERSVFNAWRYVKLVAGSAEGADRSIMGTMRVLS